MLHLPDSWTWDFWLADDGDEYHLFFLFASRSLGDPELRHRRASIGHAVSTDLVEWRRVADTLTRSQAPAFDDVATWTGSTVRGDDGRWYLFYTGCSDDPAESTQRIGVAVSDDLITWSRVSGARSEADSRWYERSADSLWFDEAWRDPWVFKDPSGDGWQMLLTARSNSGEKFERGVIGQATSPDLLSWTVHAPVTEAGGFGQLEVPQVEYVDGRWMLLFSCLSSEMAVRLHGSSGTGGVWAAIGESALGPFDIDASIRLTDDSRYAGRIVRDRWGEWQFLAFRNIENGRFVGGLADPVPFVSLLAEAEARRETPSLPKVTDDDAALVSEIGPQKRQRSEVAHRHIPHEVVPVPLDEVREFVHDALKGTSLVNPVVQVVTGWALLEPHLRFTPVDATHTRIELDVVGTARGAETLLFVQRRAEIDRFFVALQDELDRRERWRPHPPNGSAAIESGD